jgi:hypothetical protein
MRVACIKDGVVVNVIEVESLDKIPDVVAIDETGKVITKDQVKIIQTDVGSVGDIYIEGKGFFRFAGE